MSALVHPFCPHCGFDLQRDAPIIINRFSMFGQGHPLCYDNRPLKITPSEAEICWALMKAYPDRVKLDALLNRIDSDGTHNTINVLVSRIRKRFKDWGIPCPVKTLWGNGYVWDPTVA